ncbi:MAG TPA: hypothetical protein VFQ07_15260, partial [Candidatus Polarisedimenticolia bacterium]|nr:hypothetical protein [Candidatus Polarisedimenticolia bacterium]
QHAQAEDRARIIELQKQERALAEEIKKRDFRSVYNRGKLASELIRKSAFSWTQLFNTLETVVPPNVVLAAIRPNITSEGIVLRVEGVAKDHGALLTLEEKLQQHDSFKRVAPISERRLNPNLPDITFLVTCDYIPPPQLPPAVTASNDGAAAGAPDPAGAPKAGADPNAAAGKPDAKPTPAGPLAAGNVVGRDGRPKEAGPSVIAPGGLLIAQANAAPSSGKGAKKGAAPASAPTKAAAGSTPATTAATGGTPGAKTPATGGHATAASAGKTATPQKMASVPVPAPPRSFGPRNYDPNVPRTMPAPLQAAATRPKPGPPPVPAERLDMPLSFVGRPAGEVYRSLAAAHGVRIDLDPTVDPAAPVTVDLKGRRLEEALMVLAGLLHTRTTHPAEGVYRIVSTEVRAPNGDAPPTEEPVVEETHP